MVTNSKEIIKKYLIGELIVMALLIILDLVSKGVMTLADKAGVLTIIFKQDVLSFTYTKETGIFGIMKSINWLFIVLDCVLLGLLILYLVLQRKGKKFLTYTLSILIASIFCCLFDRIFCGGIRNFIDLSFMKLPIFNYTTVTIIVGALLYLVYLIFIRKRKPKIQKIGIRYVQRPDKPVEYGDDDMPTFAGFTIDRSNEPEDNYSSFQFGNYPFNMDDISDDDD